MNIKPYADTCSLLNNIAEKIFCDLKCDMIFHYFHIYRGYCFHLVYELIKWLLTTSKTLCCTICGW
jgi:hypothetical protein